MDTISINSGARSANIPNDEAIDYRFGGRYYAMRFEKIKQLLNDGVSRRSIRKRLCISHATLKAHISRINHGVLSEPQKWTNGLSKRICTMLTAGGIDSAEKLAKALETGTLRKLPNVGWKTLAEIQQWMDARNAD